MPTTPEGVPEGWVELRMVGGPFDGYVNWKPPGLRAFSMLPLDLDSEQYVVDEATGTATYARKD